MDTDTDLSTDTELVICIRIRGTRIRVSGGFGVPMSNTSQARLPDQERKGHYNHNLHASHAEDPSGR